MSSNVRLYPWFVFFRNLTFWQAVWFLYFQSNLSAAEAILLYAVYDIATTALEVPSGYLSDRVGRRVTLILSIIAAILGAALLAIGGGFWVFAAAQVLMGAGAAFGSGTDSALLYESLERDGRGEEVDRHELLAWRCSFSALAISAILGGAGAMVWDRLPFVATAFASALAFMLVLRFREPERAKENGPTPTQARMMQQALGQPVLLWLFLISLTMYIFSHVPFVFGQPFIQQALDATGLGQDAPLVSGAVTASMMVVSVATSWIGPPLRRRIGLGAIICLAFALQVGLSAVMAVSNDVLVIGILLLRMVPDSLSRAFILARIQPLLPDSARATFLSIKSFVGRLLLAISLIAFSVNTDADGPLAFARISEILGWYAIAGAVLLCAFIATARSAHLGR